jgi:hypothetical protein
MLYGISVYLYMDLIFIETPEFIRKFDRLATQDEMLILQEELFTDPRKGKIVQGSGGARKIRLKMPGAGKSGGARVIYYFVDLRGEIWFLDIYVKSDKEDLSEPEKKKIYKIIKGTIK